MPDALQIIGYYALILAMLGTLANAAIIYVTFRAKSSATFVLLRYLAVCDTLTLFFWNLNFFTKSNLNIDLENYNIYSCKIGNWIQFSSLQASAWTLVRSHFK